MTTPQELKQIVSEGLLSFPLTDFDEQGDFRADTYAERLEWLAPYGATALFAAGGTGEFFSLTHSEYSNVIRTATETCKGKVPILAGAGGATRVAIAYAQEAERLGANGILLMPHYLTEASQEGIAAHVEQVCKAVKNIGVIVYNRANSKLEIQNRSIHSYWRPSTILSHNDGGTVQTSLVIDAAASFLATYASSTSNLHKPTITPGFGTGKIERWSWGLLRALELDRVARSGPSERRQFVYFESVSQGLHQ